MIIAVDFDGTLSLAGYPHCGIPNTRLIDELNEFRRNGARLILWTCREGLLLAEALDFCKRVGIEFDAVNENLPDITEKYGVSRKVFADYYIDDKARMPVKAEKKHGMYEQAKVEVFG